MLRLLVECALIARRGESRRYSSSILLRFHEQSIIYLNISASTGAAIELPDGQRSGKK